MCTRFLDVTIVATRLLLLLQLPTTAAVVPRVLSTSACEVWNFKMSLSSSEGEWSLGSLREEPQSVLMPLTPEANRPQVIYPVDTSRVFNSRDAFAVPDTAARENAK